MPWSFFLNNDDIASVFALVLAQLRRGVAELTNLHRKRIPEQSGSGARAGKTLLSTFGTTGEKQKQQEVGEASL